MTFNNLTFSMLHCSVQHTHVISDHSRITITPDSGYLISSISLTNHFIHYTFSVTEDEKLVGKSFTMSEILILARKRYDDNRIGTIKAVAVVKKVTAVTGFDASGLTNCYTDVTVGTIDQQRNTLLFTANNGYYLPSNIVINSNGSDINVSVGDFKNSFLYTFLDVNKPLKDVAVFGVALVRYVIADYSLLKHISTGLGSKFSDSISKITFTADSGYHLPHYIDMFIGVIKTRIRFDVVGVTTDTYTFSTYELPLNKYISFQGSALKDVVVSKYADIDTSHLLHATCREGSRILKTASSITIDAEHGYEFTGSLDMTNIQGWIKTVNIKDGSLTFTYVFEANEKPLKDHLVLKASASLIVINLNAFTNLYYLTDDLLNVLANEYFYSADGFIPKMGLGGSISDIYVLPFQVPDVSYSKALEVVKIGNHKLAAKAHPFLNYTLVVDVGDVVVPEKYGNYYDYNDVDCSLLLPYFKDVTMLDIYHVIGQTVNIKYKINLYNGDALILISSTFTNQIFKIVKTDFKIDIPVLTKSDYSYLGLVGGYVDSGVNRAIIEVMRYEPYIDYESGREAKELYKNDLVSNFTGLTKFINVNLDCIIYSEEYQIIVDLMEGGIVI